MRPDPELSSPSANVVVTATGTKPDALPVLILGAGVTGIGVTRIFGRLHVPTYTVCPGSDLLATCRWFRSVRGFEKEPPRPSCLRTFLETIDVPAAVLMPCADDWA